MKSAEVKLKLWPSSSLVASSVVFFGALMWLAFFILATSRKLPSEKSIQVRLNVWPGPLHCAAICHGGRLKRWGNLFRYSGNVLELLAGKPTPTKPNLWPIRLQMTQLNNILKRVVDFLFIPENTIKQVFEGEYFPSGWSSYLSWQIIFACPVQIRVFQLATG